MTRSEFPFRLDLLFEEQAGRTPGSVALHDHGVSVTFGELRARSDALAAALRARGLGDGGFVGLHMERSIAYVISVLAILKLNGAVVPLPPAYPEARLHEILSFAALDAVIDSATSPLGPSLRSLTARIIRFEDAVAERHEWARSATGGEDQAAFVLCSSGSTGQPKMIVRSHRSFFHRLLWTWESHPYATDEACCQKSHMTTTHAIYELFEPLLRGVPVHVISDQEVRALETFWETVRALAISRLLLVPSMLQASFDVPGFVAPPVNVVVLMGEYVHPRLAERAIEGLSRQTKIYSIYGSTEASSTFVCDVRQSWRHGEELPLGVPISADVHDAVLDEHGMPVPAGDAGILHIGGTPLFTEYLKSPEQTAAAFAPGIGRTERLFETRDRVRRISDGSLQFLGRADHTVKVRGFRVDLEEVERAIMLLPSVRQCAVVARQDEPGATALIAFVAPATVKRSTVYQMLREQLPAYMVPSTIVGTDAFPLTSSGKIDRQRLMLERAQPGRGEAVDAERSPTEQRISRVWQTVLEHDAFEVQSNFFQVGGSSLTAFAVVYRLRDEFGVARSQLSDQSLYQHPTIRGLATYVDGLRAGDSPAATPGQSLLVTLKRATDASRAPVFMISSAGGTLGAYDKLVKSLQIANEVIGVRDPFLWGMRDPTLGFQSMITGYVRAIQERQPRGPYNIIAYSSAGSVGYEIAQHLRRAGQDVALLALIDPLGMDRGSKQRFGHWAIEARFSRHLVTRATLAAGWLRLAIPRLFRDAGRTAREYNVAPTQAAFLKIATRAKTTAVHVRSISALLELNSGLPFTLTESEMINAAPDRYLEALQARVRRVAPEIDPEMIERIAVQYEMQVRWHHAYRLQRYDGRTILFDPMGAYHGLLAAQFRPYVRNLLVRGVVLGEQSDRVRAISECFPKPIRSHYQSMRDDTFVRGVAEVLESALS
jgi:amino acid adenylation domain-containing protein